jgi:hypothetical protein
MEVGLSFAFTLLYMVMVGGDVLREALAHRGQNRQMFEQVGGH